MNSPAPHITNQQFLEVLFSRLHSESAVAVCTKSDLSKPGFFVTPWQHGQCYHVKHGGNAYYCTSSHLLADPFRRTKDNFTGLHVVGLDDIGTKIPKDRIKLKASYELETSDGNFQIGYILKEPITDIGVVDRIGKALVRTGLTDEGAGGLASRLFRLPQGWNSKREHLWQCGLAAWRPELAYSIEELLSGLGVELDPPKPERPKYEAAQATQSSPYGRKALETECAELAAMEPETGRNTKMNKIAFRVGQLVAGGELVESEAVAALEQAACDCGLPEHETVKTLRSGLEDGKQDPRSAPAQENVSTVEDPDKLATARQLFPKIPFPWACLPATVSGSLQQLARACATSATPLPGVALCMVSAAIGRKFAVSAKESWTEPLVFWCADIRPSGAGKTPAMQAMARTFKDLQAAEHERYRKELAEWDMLTPKDRKGQIPPLQPRGYFTTNLTLEGIHSDLEDHPTGGIVATFSELSAFLNGQGEYKAGKGTDRESWLQLHDGNAARVVRASKSVMIRGARVQICGGIQPTIFGKLFSGQDGTYLVDGTIFRFLTTYENASYFPLTAESWSTENAGVWGGILRSAFAWADARGGTLTAELSQEAQNRFLDWRNAMEEHVQDLPAQFRGFMPKAYGYALRLAGAFHLMDRFSRGLEPGRVLHIDDMERGIETMQFYLGQAVDAIRLTETPDSEATVDTTRAATLAMVLDQLRGEVCNGKLAVDYIRVKYNEQVQPEERVNSGKIFAGIIRSCGIETIPGIHDANGKTRVTCICWSEKIDRFIKSSLVSLASKAGHRLDAREEEKIFSRSSRRHGLDQSETERTERIEKVSLGPLHEAGQGFGEKREEREKISNRNIFSSSDIVEGEV